MNWLKRLWRAIAPIFMTALERALIVAAEQAVAELAGTKGALADDPAANHRVRKILSAQGHDGVTDAAIRAALAAAIEKASRSGRQGPGAGTLLAILIAVLALAAPLVQAGTARAETTGDGVYRAICQEEYRTTDADGAPVETMFWCMDAAGRSGILINTWVEYPEGRRKATYQEWIGFRVLEDGRIDAADNWFVRSNRTLYRIDRDTQRLTPVEEE